jgi:hypothetical protein
MLTESETNIQPFIAPALLALAYLGALIYQIKEYGLIEGTRRFSLGMLGYIGAMIIGAILLLVIYGVLTLLFMGAMNNPIGRLGSY